MKGGIKSPILKEVKKDDKITILDSGDKWDKVATEDGVIGYIKRKLCPRAKKLSLRILTMRKRPLRISRRIRISVLPGIR